MYFLSSIGPALPNAMDSAFMISLPTTVILSGGRDLDSYYYTQLYQLVCTPIGCAWEEMEPTLTHGRRDHISTLVPNLLLSCN